MPRANRKFAQHGVWHLTHRCHNKDFLLKFVRDRHFWRMCLFEARRRYGVCVLNYIATSNHVHILVDSHDADTVPAAMRYVAGRTAQQYNRRKKRHGAFWEDRYHAVPVRSQAHLLECLVYIDLNMVRAGAVSHPAQWLCSGYNDIQSERQRYWIIDTRRLLELAGADSLSDFQASHRLWIDERLARGGLVREPRWTCDPDGPEKL